MTALDVTGSVTVHPQGNTDVGTNIHSDGSDVCCERSGLERGETFTPKMHFDVTHVVIPRKHSPVRKNTISWNAGASVNVLAPFTFAKES
ncbi:hypothetical protein F2P81_005181 [Scophthalmus maximus]|uniref:Uncharacterized protein n=1 Tax=Scophthalmus maximus TaxID=52904 RepID=A0A6A4T9Y5_SCOMX|nr:hypothetical protein F2P81_005181 [Scophthalmus maximus]